MQAKARTRAILRARDARPPRSESLASAPRQNWRDGFAEAWRASLRDIGGLSTAKPSPIPSPPRADRPRPCLVAVGVATRSLSSVTTNSFHRRPTARNLNRPWPGRQAPRSRIFAAKEPEVITFEGDKRVRHDGGNLDPLGLADHLVVACKRIVSTDIGLKYSGFNPRPRAVSRPVLMAPARAGKSLASGSARNPRPDKRCRSFVADRRGRA